MSKKDGSFLGVGWKIRSVVVFSLGGTAVIFGMPILIDVLLGIPTPWLYGDRATWLGFFGNYIGGIIGALVAIIILSIQLRAQHLAESKKELEERISQHALESSILKMIQFDLVKASTNLEMLKRKMDEPDGYRECTLALPFFSKFSILEQVRGMRPSTLVVDLLQFELNYDEVFKAFSVDVNSAQRLNTELLKTIHVFEEQSTLTLQERMHYMDLTQRQATLLESIEKNSILRKVLFEHFFSSKEENEYYIIATVTQINKEIGDYVKAIPE